MSFEYVDKLFAEGFKEQVEYLKKELPVLTSAMETLSKAGKDTGEALNRTRTLRDMVDNTEKLANVNKEVKTTVDVLGQSFKAAEAAKAKYNGSTKELVAVSKTLADTTLKEAKAATENAKQKEIETRMTIALTKEKERLEKAVLREQKAAEQAENQYLKQRAEYDKQSLALKGMIVQYGLAHDGVQTLKAEVDKLYNSLLKAEQAVGQHQRKVGQYENAAMAVSQLIRETPSLAYGVNTFLSAIGNNLPILIDQFKILKSELGSTSAAVRVMGASLFSFTNVVSLALTAILLISSGVISFGKDVSGAKEKLKEYEDEIKNVTKAQRELNSATQASILIGKQELETVVTQLTHAKSIEAKVDAYNKLKDIMPGILRGYSQEEVLAGKANDAIFKHMEQINALKAEIKELQPVYEKQVQLFEKTKARVEELKQKLGPDWKFADKTIAANFAQQLDDMVKNGIRLDQLKRQLAEFAAPDLPKNKETKDNTLKNENDLTKELYAEYAKRLQLSAEVQRAISEDETKSLEQRLMAYRQFSELSFEAQALGLSAQMDAVDNSLREIERIEGISANKRTQQEKDLLARKSLLRQQYNNISAEYDLLEQQHIDKTAKGIVALQQNEVNKRLEAITSLSNNVEIQEAQAQRALVERLKSGSINYRQYTAEKKAIDDKYQKEKYQQIVDYLTLEIAALAAQGVDTRKMQEALNAAMKHLYDADTQNALDAARRKEEGEKAVQSAVQSAVQQSIETNRAFVDAYYEKQIQYQQNLIDAIEERKNAEIDAINNTMQSDEKKQKQIQALNAQTAQQEKQIRQEMRRLKREEAIADRVAATLNVVANTAAGVARALKDYSWPYNLIVGGIVGAVGAAQIAAIYAQPLPQYAKGTEDHPGGKALVGEEYKPELIIEPGKDPYFISKPTVKHFPKHTRVIPEAQLVAGGLGFLTPQLLQGIYAPSTDFGAIEKKLDENADRITSAIRNKPETQFIASNGEFKKVVKRGNSYYTYLSDNF